MSLCDAQGEPISPQAEAEWVAQQLRGTYKMIEGAGHYPHAEMPEIVAPLILDFLRSRTKGNSSGA
jgi:pimeloyl-ACP methyl ester carboxylesterase